jgi:hypothetical protein
MRIKNANNADNKVIANVNTNASIASAHPLYCIGRASRRTIPQATNAKDDIEHAHIPTNITRSLKKGSTTVRHSQNAPIATNVKAFSNCDGTVRRETIPAP